MYCDALSDEPYYNSSTTPRTGVITNGRQFVVPFMQVTLNHRTFNYIY